MPRRETPTGSKPSRSGLACRRIPTCSFSAVAAMKRENCKSRTCKNWMTRARASGIPSFRPESDDPAYRFVAPEDGTYRILIRDLYAGSRGDPRLIYALAIRRAAPDFRLVAVPAYHANLTAPSDSAAGQPAVATRRHGNDQRRLPAARRIRRCGSISQSKGCRPA